MEIAMLSSGIEVVLEKAKLEGWLSRPLSRKNCTNLARKDFSLPSSGLVHFITEKMGIELGLLFILSIFSSRSKKKSIKLKYILKYVM